MNNYFKLQHKIIDRKLREFGLHPVAGYFLGLLGLLALSVLLFYKTQYAPWIYVAFCVASVANLGETYRNEFLKTTFSIRDFRLIRTVENFAIAIPFILYLGYEGEFLASAVLVIAVFALSRINFNRGIGITLPTPFYRYPFEFTVGFRKYFVLFILSYVLVVIGVVVPNFNLGAFALAIIPLTCLAFYGKPEGRFYVWMHAHKPHEFLFHKIKVALFYLTIVTMPACIVLGIFFPDRIWILLIILALGYVYLSTIILAKYDAYPFEINLPQALLIAISFAFPPFLLVLGPYFFAKARRNLITHLE